MARHSFIQESKLRNVKGRIDYITNPERQENLYAVYESTERGFWQKLSHECQQEYLKNGTTGTCVEARELIIALPEEFVKYSSEEVLTDFTEFFKNKYGVECISALHHNKAKTNYHIHLIFSERKWLEEPEIKTASRAIFYDESGKRVRTKKEIKGEDGEIRRGCRVIKKGEIYEQHYFSKKTEYFKTKAFLAEIKEAYTAKINEALKQYKERPESYLSVYQADSIYLPMKKIGKNNPKENVINADNEVRTEWNRKADLALVTGVSEQTILEIKREHILKKAETLIRSHGKKPEIFRMVVLKAKAILAKIMLKVHEELQPIPDENTRRFYKLNDLRIAVNHEANLAKEAEIKAANAGEKLKKATGFFQGGERKRLREEIATYEQQSTEHIHAIEKLVREAGFPDVQTFKQTLDSLRPDADAHIEKYRNWHSEQHRLKEGLQVDIANAGREEIIRKIRKQEKRKHSRSQRKSE